MIFRAKTTIKVEISISAKTLEEAQDKADELYTEVSLSNPGSTAARFKKIYKDAYISCEEQPLNWEVQKED